MPLMFIPAAVGIIETWETVEKTWLPFCLIMGVSTFVVMIAAGWSTTFFLKYTKKSENVEEGKNG